MNFYVRLIIVVLIVLALAEAIPEVVNAFLLLMLASMILMQSGQFARLISALKL